MIFEIFASLVFIADYLAGLISWWELTIAINLLLVWGIVTVKLQQETKLKENLNQICNEINK